MTKIQHQWQKPKTLPQIWKNPYGKQVLRDFWVFWKSPSEFFDKKSIVFYDKILHFLDRIFRRPLPCPCLFVYVLRPPTKYQLKHVKAQYNRPWQCLLFVVLYILYVVLFSVYVLFYFVYVMTSCHCVVMQLYVMTSCHCVCHVVMSWGYTVFF